MYNNHKTYKRNKGSDLRQKLVTLYKYKKLEEYDKITDKIITDYIDNKNDIFLHLNNKFNTFSERTKISLERFLTRAQEEAIQESMPYLYEIMIIKNKL